MTVQSAVGQRADDMSSNWDALHCMKGLQQWQALPHHQETAPEIWGIHRETVIYVQKICNPGRHTDILFPAL